MRALAPLLLGPCCALAQVAPPEPPPAPAANTSTTTATANSTPTRSPPSVAGAPSVRDATARGSGSILVDRFRSADVEALLARPLPPEGDANASDSARRTQFRLERETAVVRAALRELRRTGFARDASRQDRELALDTLRKLRGPIELGEALAILGGNANESDLIERDREARRALLLALADDATFGEPALVRLAITAEDKVRADALAALPPAISPDAEGELARFLGGDREMHVNRAASIASAHAGAGLIPPLIAAQSTPPRQKRGDEAWIALGKSVSYIAGAVPVVGDASGAFQPIPGTIFEGSVFRVMESVVVVYRTEVYYSLRRVVERETGQPAPPFGWDQQLWTRWYEQEFPKLAAAEADRRSHEDAVRRTKGERDGLGVER